MKVSRRSHRQFDREQQEADDVVLRRWRNGGDVIALFPKSPATLDGLATSYRHVGQHGAADYQHVISMTVPVTVSEPDPERDALLDELRSVGYAPRLRRRSKASRGRS